MRIALLGPANSIHLQRWASGLAERGHEIALITQHPGDPKLLPASVRTFRLPHAGPLGYFRNAAPLRTLLAQWKPQLVNTHYASGYGSTSAIAGFAPTLLSVWGSDVYDFPFQGRPQAWLIRRNLRRATAIASTSEAMAAQVRRLLPTAGTIAITPFGVDLARFAPPATPPAAGPLTIGIVKTLAPKYGVDLLIRAFAGLVRGPIAEGGPPCRLVVVGDGPQRARLEALARTLGVAERIEFAGAVPHRAVPDHLRSFDLYVAPSRLDSESFGVAVIEASACGLPVVVSDAGGLPEVVLDGRTGLVVARDDPLALQAALEKLVSDPALRARLGRQGRAHVALHYEWSHCIDLMVRAYGETLDRFVAAGGDA